MKKILTIGFLSAILLVGSFSFAHAALILDTEDNGTFSASTQSNWLMNSDASELNGQTISYVGFYVEEFGGDTGIWDILFSDCSTGNFSTSYNTSIGWNYFLYEKTLPADVTAVPCHLTISRHDPGIGKIRTLSGSGGEPLSRWYDEGGIAPADTSTRIIPPYTPSTGSTAASTTVGFSFDYYFNCTTSFGVYDSATVAIRDLTTGSEVVDIFPQSVNICGQGSYVGTTTLTAGHLYLWNPKLYSSATSSATVLGEFYSLEVLYASASSTPFTGATVGTSTLLSTTNLLSFLNVPQLLQTKVPFGYFFQIRDAILEGAGASSTTAIPSGLISYKIGQNATTTIDMFSTSTIAYYVTPGIASTFRGLMVIFLYIEFAYFMYHRARSKHLI